VTELTKPATLPQRARRGVSNLRHLLGGLGRRDLAKDTVFGLSFEGALLVSTLLSFSLLGRSLGTDGFGDYASLYAIAAPLNTLATTGVALAQAEHVIRSHEDLESTTRSCFSLSLIAGVIMTIIATTLGVLIVHGVPVHAMVPIFLLEFVSFPAVLLAANTVQVQDGYAASTSVRVIPIMLRIVILVTLFALGRLTIFALGITYLIGTVVVGLVQIHRVGRRYGIKIRPGRVHARHLKSDLVYSAGVSGFAVQNDGDKTVLQAYNLRTDVGLYSAAYKIVQFGLIPVNAFMTVSHNRFLIHEDDARGQHLRRAVRFGGVCAAYGLVFGIAVAICAPMITLIIGRDFEGSVEIVRWLAPLVLLRALLVFPLNGLMGLGHTRLRTGLLLGGAAISLTLYIALVPLWQWKGAAIGTLAGEALLGAAAWTCLVVLERRRDAALPREVPVPVPL
jgi:O-antigen/teichoic acid export membrane protein